MANISISEILKICPLIKLATNEDNSRIINFLKTVTMQVEGMELFYDRSPNFFSFLEEQGYKSFVFLFENPDGALHGMAIITLQKAYVNKKEHTVAYLSDLRINDLLNKKVRVYWRKIYASILKNCNVLTELDNCKYFYSAILGGNKAAIKSLTKNNGEVIYDKLCDYQAITILGRIFKIFLDKNYILKKGSDFSRKELVSFLNSVEVEKNFGCLFNQKENCEYERREMSWKHFDIADFLIVCNTDGKIISATLPWCDGDSRKLVVKKASTLNKLLGISKLLLGTKPLFEGKSLKFLYLTHLSFNSSLNNEERSQIMKHYLRYLFRKGILKKFHGISFFDFTGFSDKLHSKVYVKQRTQGHLFQVHHVENTDLVEQGNCSFEIATS